MMKFICTLAAVCALCMEWSLIHSLKHVISIKLFFVATAVFTLHFNFHGLFILPLFSSSFPIWHHLFSGNCFFSGNYIHKMCKPDFHIVSYGISFCVVFHSIASCVYPHPYHSVYGICKYAMLA